MNGILINVSENEKKWIKKFKITSSKVTKGMNVCAAQIGANKCKRTEQKYMLELFF